MTRGWTPTTELAQNMQVVEGAGLRARHVPGPENGYWKPSHACRAFSSMPEEGLEPPTRGL
jgi:hypothetical protein